MNYPYIVYLPADLDSKMVQEQFASERIGWEGGYDGDYKQWMRWNIYAIPEDSFDPLMKEIKEYRIPHKIR